MILLYWSKPLKRGGKTTGIPQCARKMRCLQESGKVEAPIMNSQKQIKAQTRPGLHLYILSHFLTYTRALTRSKPHPKRCYLLVLFLAALNVLCINIKDKS